MRVRGHANGWAYGALPKVIATAAFGMTSLALSAGLATAGPYCYETGPGFEKCISSPSGDYFNPIYAGPKVDHKYLPWVPTFISPPISGPAPPPIDAGDNIPATPTTGCPDGTYVDPTNLSSCVLSTPGNDYVALAASPSMPTAAAFGAATNQGEADQIAIAQCIAGTNSACQVVARAYHACAAIALSPNGNLAGGTGHNLDAATAAALNSAPGGHALGGRCSEPPGN